MNRVTPSKELQDAIALSVSNRMDEIAEKIGSNNINDVLKAMHNNQEEE